MEYTSSEVPSLFDPISSATELNQQMASDHPPGKLGNPETVNGIATKTVEATSPDGKTKMWISDRGGYLFPVKVVIIGADGKEQSYLEMKQLSFAKPAASVFTAPSGCTKVQGESSATGGHAEFGTGDSSTKLSTNVSAVTLQEIPNYNGVCPAHIKMVGTITADGPGKVFYRFGAGTYEKGQTIAFSAAGTKTVSQVMNFNPELGGGMGVSAILEAVGVDAKGQPGMMTKGSNNADFSITCASAGAKSTGASTKTPTSTVAQGEKTNAQVTDVQLKVTPANYSGPCPVKVKLLGTLTADGPGKGYYEFQAGAVGANREGAVDLKAAGNETVASEGVVRSTPQVPTVRFLAGMEPRGSQENAKWTDVDLNITCTPAK
jgi:hypothetical protein